MMKSTLSRRFSRSEEGGLSVEAVLVLPLLVWAITATFVFWDAFKALNTAQKATYTVADMLSRETLPIDADYLTTMHEVFDFLSGDGGSDNALRVTVVTRFVDDDAGIDELRIVWSQGVNLEGYDDIAVLENRLPTIAEGEQLIFVESEQDWSPEFAAGLGSYRFRKVALARPRFTPQLVWQS